MDYNKIGQFIASERKLKNLTQSQLAEKISVSEKTLSKWENGRGVPDTETLPKLCGTLDITINELLSGERISSENYVKTAEERLLDLQKKKENVEKFLLNTEVVFGVVMTFLFLLVYAFAVYAIEKWNMDVLSYVVLAVSFVAYFIAVFWMLRIEQKAGYYECARCGHKHVPTFLQVCFAMHVNRTRYMKCPKCKKRSWQSKVVK